MGLGRTLWLLGCLSVPALARTAGTLPVYIEDSHAGAFYWIAGNLNLTSDFELVLIDAHSDSSELADSDVVRQRLLESAGANQLDGLMRQWRSRGVIQCFNWIEPLMSRPITKVWWVAGDSLTEPELAQRRREVRAQINAHELVRPRRAGDLSSRFEVLDWNRFRRTALAGPVVVSIDLDYFVTQPDSGGGVARVLDSVLKLPQLGGLTFAISRPYLKSEDQAHLLLGEALRYLVRVVNADIHFEPFAQTGEDWSQRAKQYYAKGAAVPRYDIEQATALLKSVLLQNSARIVVREQPSRWNALLERWRCDEHVPRAGPPLQEVAAGAPVAVKVDTRGSRTIRWMALLPAHATYNLTGEQQGFADRAARYVSYVETPIAGADDLDIIDDARLLPYFDRRTGLGTLRLFCQVRYGNDTYLSNIVEIVRYRGVGYPARLTELFNLPYVYGGASLSDARYGADCSSFVIYGRRRQGGNIPYVNPQGLLRYLEPLDEFHGFRAGVAQGTQGPIAITDELLRDGIVLHFGKHVAAVYDGVGVLRNTTPVVHQLEGVAEITTLGAMAAKYPRIRILKFRKAD